MTTGAISNSSGGGSSPVLQVKGLSKTFAEGFWIKKKLTAVVDASFDVLSGEIFGFLGPNGAGKTTTIKMCMGIIRPSGGSIRIFDQHPDALEVRRQIGFLPEQPQFYDYLTASELLSYYGKLFGIPKRECARRSLELLDRLGIGDAKDQRLRTFSKGMLQRFGMAQALLNDPKLVVLDEPLSGLDPIGRKQLRDILLDLKSEGKTLFFSSHILSDIETICDRVAIIQSGRIQSIGALDELLNAEKMTTEIVIRVSDVRELDRLQTLPVQLASRGEAHVVVVDGKPDQVLQMLTLLYLLLMLKRVLRNRLNAMVIYSLY